MIDLIDLNLLPPVATPVQVARVIQTTKASLAQDRYRRRGIPFTKVAGRVRYLRQDVLDYLAANRAYIATRPTR
jgi:hypothetical protein